VSAEDIARCATITVDGERLTCYDRLARAKVPEGHALAAPPSEQEHPDQSFGVVKPSTLKPPGLSRIEAKILEVTEARGVVAARLDNDQTWIIDDGPAVLRAGDSIVIKRAALGSFLMSTPTKRVYRVQRLR
jgi:hypothetical protein